MPKNNKRGLGRGIEALFQENKEQNDKENNKSNIFDNLPIELIRPNPLST
ncbi:MAG: hypothetical protein ACJ0G9_07375 [Alphaproteobacteria bacterium]